MDLKNKDPLVLRLTKEDWEDLIAGLSKADSEEVRTEMFSYLSLVDVINVMLAKARRGVKITDNDTSVIKEACRTALLASVSLQTHLGMIEVLADTDKAIMAINTEVGGKPLRATEEDEASLSDGDEPFQDAASASDDVQYILRRNGFQHVSTQNSYRINKNAAGVQTGMDHVGSMYRLEASRSISAKKLNDVLVAKGYRGKKGPTLDVNGLYSLSYEHKDTGARITVHSSKTGQVQHVYLESLFDKGNDTATAVDPDFEQNSQSTTGTTIEEEIWEADPHIHVPEKNKKPPAQGDQDAPAPSSNAPPAEDTKADDPNVETKDEPAAEEKPKAKAAHHAKHKK